MTICCTETLITFNLCLKDVVDEHCWYNREREREIAGFSYERHKFHWQLHFWEPLLIRRRNLIQIFERESRLAADIGIGIMTLAVQ